MTEQTSARRGTSETSRVGPNPVRIPTYKDLTPEEKARADRILALARAGRSEGDPNASSDHSWLYDEFGLPK
jgi:hypothetical protein